MASSSIVFLGELVYLCTYISFKYQLVFLTNPCRYKQLCWKIGFNYLGIATDCNLPYNTRLTSGWVGSIQLAELSKIPVLAPVPSACSYIHKYIY